MLFAGGATACPGRTESCLFPGGCDVKDKCLERNGNVTFFSGGSCTAALDKNKPEMGECVKNEKQSEQYDTGI